MAVSGQITVTTEQLSTQAQAVRVELKVMQDNFETLRNLMNGTASYWKGAASDAHRDLYISKITSVEEMFSRYEEHIRDLEQMAEIYTQAERVATNAVDSLPLCNLD